MDLIYVMEELDTPSLHCIVCQTDLSDAEDKQPLTTPYPNADAPRQVFAYSCRPCLESRRTEVTAYAEALFRTIIHDKMKVKGVRLDDGTVA